MGRIKEGLCVFRRQQVGTHQTCSLMASTVLSLLCTGTAKHRACGATARETDWTAQAVRKALGSRFLNEAEGFHED